MKYTVFVSVPNTIEIEANSEEDAKQKVLGNLISTKQIKPADYVEIKVAEEKHINS